MIKLSVGDLFEIGLRLRKKHGLILSFTSGYLGFDFDDGESGGAEALETLTNLINEQIEAKNGQIR